MVIIIALFSVLGGYALFVSYLLFDFGNCEGVRKGLGAKRVCWSQLRNSVDSV